MTTHLRSFIYGCLNYYGSTVLLVIICRIDCELICILFPTLGINQYSCFLRNLFKGRNKYGTHSISKSQTKLTFSICVLTPNILNNEQLAFIIVSLLLDMYAVLYKHLLNPCTDSY